MSSHGQRFVYWLAGQRLCVVNDVLTENYQQLSHALTFLDLYHHLVSSEGIQIHFRGSRFGGGENTESHSVNP